MIRNVTQDGCESAYSLSFVLRNCDVMLSSLACRESHVASGLASDPVAELLKYFSEFVSR